MDSLGKHFQAARESQGLTLEQMASRTRIQKSHLKALEEDSFGPLPEQVFTKGFVRSYARSLNLDEEECLRLFAECSASFYQKEKEGKGQQRRFLLKGEEKEERASRAMVVLLIGGLFLLGGMVLLEQQSPSTSIFSRFSQQAVAPRDEGVSKPEQPGDANESLEDRQPASSERHVDPSSVSNTQAVPKPDVAKPPAESPVNIEAATPPSSPPDSTPSVPPPTGSQDSPLVLELRTLETTWVKVGSDENEPEEALLQAGETVQWRANERFLLTLGNAGGVEVRLNGQVIGPFGEAGVVARNLDIRP